VIVTGLALIVNSRVVGIRGGKHAALVTMSLTIVIALSVALLFALATPWRGAIEVSGHPIGSVITDLKTGYFHRWSGRRRTRRMPAARRTGFELDHPFNRRAFETTVPVHQ
jgi:hypothetical protein